MAADDTLKELRRENLRKLAIAAGGPSEAARKLGMPNPSFLVQMIGPNPTRNVSEKMARRVEAEFRLPTYALDAGVFIQPSPQNNSSPTADLCYLNEAFAAAGLRPTARQLTQAFALTQRYAPPSERSAFVDCLVATMKPDDD